MTIRAGGGFLDVHSIMTADTEAMIRAFQSRSVRIILLKRIAVAVLA
jgi:hypothetical protein